jgi:hypothetical protein
MSEKNNQTATQTAPAPVVVQTDATKEKAEREAAEQRFKETQLGYLADIVATYATMEKDRSKPLLSLARKMSDYADNALRHAAESGKAKALTVAVGGIETALRAHTDETVGVSRLLGVYGLACVVDDKEVIGAVPVSILKVLLPLIVRDATAPGLAYVWKEKLNESGMKLVRECADGKHTVLAASKERDRIMSLAAGALPVESDKPADGSKGGTKSPVEKAARKVASALTAAGKLDPDTRKAAVQRLVKTDGLTVSDIVVAINTLARNGKGKGLRTIAAALKAAHERYKAKMDAKAEPIGAVN